MKTILSAPVLAFALTFACGSFVLAHAQQLQSDGTVSQPAATQQGHHAPNPVHQAKHMSRKLGLTPEQSARLEPILADRDARLSALRNDTTLDARTLHRQGHAIKLDTENRINALLTPQQQQLYSDLRAARHHHGAPAATPPASA